MKKIAVFFIMLLLVLSGCAKEEKFDQVLSTSTAVESASASETAILETVAPTETEAEEVLLPPKNCYYPTRRITNGTEVYDFGMELYNDTESALTVVSMHVVDYSAGEEVENRTYVGRELDVFNGDRPARYTMEPDYPLVLFMEEKTEVVTFDSRVITVVLQAENGEQTERVFHFQVDDEQEALYPDPEETKWLPALLQHQSRQFPCLIINDTDQPLTLTGMYSIQYVNSNPVRFSYRNPDDSYISQITELLPGESAVWIDGISDNNMFATHRKYVMYYEDPRGNVYEKVFFFKVDRENEPVGIPMLDYGLVPETSGIPEYTAEQIQEMIDEDLSLEEITEKISTIADLVQYLQFKGYGQDQRGDLKFQYDGTQWHASRSAHVVFADNSGNCGGGSNLANYILQGDYEKQGYIHYAGNQGGHIFNYFYRDGYYYVMDLTVLFDWTPVKVVKDLSEFADAYVMENHAQNTIYQNNYIRLMYAHERDGNSHAVIAGKPLIWVADEVQHQLQLLYQDEDAFAPIFAPAPPVENWPIEAQ